MSGIRIEPLASIAMSPARTPTPARKRSPTVRPNLAPRPPRSHARRSLKPTSIRPHPGGGRPVTALTCFRCGEVRDLDTVICDDGFALSVEEYLALVKAAGLVPLCERCAEQIAP